MQTRRRHQQTDQQDYSSNYSVPHTPQEQQQQHHQQLQHTLIQPGQQQLLYVAQQPTFEAAINIGEPLSGPRADSDDKYDKAARQWNLFSGISTRSGQALRTFIQQPLSAAAAVVTGNHPVPASSSDNNNSVYNFGQSQAQPAREEFDSEPEQEIFIMAARDRTGEFSNAIRSLQSRNITRAVNIRDPRKAKQVQSYSEFMMVARFIGKNIASTYAKLEKLTMRK